MAFTMISEFIVFIEISGSPGCPLTLALGRQENNEHD